MRRNRREFLEHVGTGMLTAGIGSGLVGDLGNNLAFAEETEGTLDFGSLRPLVQQIQETPASKLQPLLVKSLRSGQSNLKQLIAAAALANAETFGGQDYVGYHTEMALLPALNMAAELPAARQPLPVLKVIYRNADRIQSSGSSGQRVLKPIRPVNEPDVAKAGQMLRDAARQEKMEYGERLLAARVAESKQAAFNDLLWAVQDAANVHRFVLAYRAWGLIDVVGEQHAHTMLRQCVRYCVQQERHNQGSPIRAALTRNLDQFKLVEKGLGQKRPDDNWVLELSEFIFKSNGVQSMEAVAGALGDGIDPHVIGEALSLAANQLVLTQGQNKNGTWRAHGATPGVHASDAVNAWRNMIKVMNERNVAASLLVSGYHVGSSKAYRQIAAMPHLEHLEQIKVRGQDELLSEVAEAVQQNDQGRAAAAVQLYGEQGYPTGPLFGQLLSFAISEDGRLHAEKYYHTVREEFATTRPAFRWRQLAALARVTASSYGFDVNDQPGHRAPGYLAACRELKLDT